MLRSLQDVVGSARNVASIITKGASLHVKYKQYLSLLGGTRLGGFPKRKTVEASADPFEFFSYYSAFAYFSAKIISESKAARVLDVGGQKTANAVLAAFHDVTAIVLRDPDDNFSSVKWVVRDVSDGLPFDDASFDFITSCASFHLLGLGRYGDKLNPSAHATFAAESYRVLKPGGRLLFSSTLGRDFLSFNNGWVFSLQTYKDFFRKFEFEEWVVDHNSCGPYKHGIAQRFTREAEGTGQKQLGEYDVVFFCLRKVSCQPAESSS